VDDGDTLNLCRDLGLDTAANMVHLVTPAQARLLLNRDTDRAVLDALLGEGSRCV
jgi:hypothetical protein